MRARAVSHFSIRESSAAAQDCAAGTTLRTGSNISQWLALRAAVLRRAVSQWSWGRCHASGNAQVPPRRPWLCSSSAAPSGSRSTSCASSNIALTLPSKGRPTAGHTASLRHGQPRRWPPLMSNVRGPENPRPCLSFLELHVRIWPDGRLRLSDDIASVLHFKRHVLLPTCRPSLRTVRVALQSFGRRACQPSR